MKEIFISFSSKQTEEAERIYNFLEAQGLSCFISTRDLVPGEEYASQLVNFLDEASVMVLLLSTDSNNSPHVLREVEYAVSHHIPILVYSLEEVTLSRSMEYFLMTHQWITGNGSKDEMLINGVRKILAHRNENRSETESSTATGTENTISPQSRKNKVAKISPRHSLFPLLCVCLLLIVIALLMILVLRKPAGSNDNGAFASSGKSTAVAVLEEELPAITTFPSGVILADAAPTL